MQHKFKSIALSVMALAISQPLFAHELPIVDQPVVEAHFQRPTIELRGGQWFDGERFGKARWYIVDGKFTAKRPRHIDAVIDLGRRYVLPPLAEAHNHNMQNSWGAATFAQDYMRRGIFYSAQLGANSEEIMPFRGLLNNPGTPDVLFAEVIISASDGHPLRIALDGAKQVGIAMTADDIRDHAYYAVDTLADLDKRWPKMAATGTKLIKVILNESELYKEHYKDPKYFGVNGIDPALLPEIVKRAHSIGARVAVHTDTAHDAEVAVNAGADIIAHLPGYRIDAPLTPADYRLRDTTIAEAAKRGTYWIGTVAASRYFLAKYADHTDAVMGNYRDNITRLRAAGVRFLTGSDLFDGSVIDELVAVDGLKVMPRAELLRDATMQTPKAMFPDRKIGCLCEGAEASLIAFDGNPIEDLSVLRTLSLAIKNGELLSR